jgi:molybdopterin molybdotransferase
MNELNIPKPTDVRMKGFAKRSSVGACVNWIDEHVSLLPIEQVSLEAAHQRVLATDIISSQDVPQFTRSMMDGFAVQAADTAGASNYQPQQLTVLGESVPGKPFAGSVTQGTAVRIMTGAPLPDGADSVLPAEQVQIEADFILAQGQVAPQKHVGFPGEDIQQGTTVLTTPRILRPQDLGVLSSIGFSQVPVFQQPRVRVIVTGNELLPPGTATTEFCIADANSPMLAALISRDGGHVINPGILPDDPNSIRDALLDPNANVIIVSGGSSVGQEDYAPGLLAELGSLDIHGIAMRPSSPSGIGMLNGRLVFLLPGNPVSCLCAYDFFAGRAIRQMSGLPAQWPYHHEQLPLSRKLTSAIGRIDYARVKIIDGQVHPLAISGASVLSSTTAADGFVVIDENLEGYAEDCEVTVFRYN